MEEVNENLKWVQHWCCSNKITINLKKTNYMIITSRQRQITMKGILKISETEIIEVNEASFVGLSIDRHLTWKNHIQAVNKSIRKKVGILFKLRHFVP